MERKQLISRKVKLQLVQPQIICSGRDRADWYGRGKIITENESNYLIKFKYKGKVVSAKYNKEKREFILSQYKDIQLTIL